MTMRGGNDNQPVGPARAESSSPLTTLETRLIPPAARAATSRIVGRAAPQRGARGPCFTIV
jgi:hypothetical protein